MRLVGSLALPQACNAGVGRCRGLADVDLRLHPLTMTHTPGEEATDSRAYQRGGDDQTEDYSLALVDDHATPLIFSSVRTPKVAPL